MDQTQYHLRLLTVFHYVVAGMTVFFSCMFFPHLIVGLYLLIAPPEEGARLGGLIVTPLMSFIVFCCWALAAAIFYAGRCIERRHRHVLCLVVAGLECLMMPFGTVLGVFTILVLMKPEVKELFGVGVDAPR